MRADSVRSNPCCMRSSEIVQTFMRARRGPALLIEFEIMLWYSLMNRISKSPAGPFLIHVHTCMPNCQAFFSHLSFFVKIAEEGRSAGPRSPGSRRIFSKFQWVQDFAVSDRPDRRRKALAFHCGARNYSSIHRETIENLQLFCNGVTF